MLPASLYRYKYHVGSGTTLVQKCNVHCVTVCMILLVSMYSRCNPKTNPTCDTDSVTLHVVVILVVTLCHIGWQCPLLL